MLGGHPMIRGARSGADAPGVGRVQGPREPVPRASNGFGEFRSEGQEGRDPRGEGAARAVVIAGLEPGSIEAPEVTPPRAMDQDVDASILVPVTALEKDGMACDPEQAPGGPVEVGEDSIDRGPEEERGLGDVRCPEGCIGQDVCTQGFGGSQDASGPGARTGPVRGIGGGRAGQEHRIHDPWNPTVLPENPTEGLDHGRGPQGTHLDHAGGEVPEECCETLRHELRGGMVNPDHTPGRLGREQRRQGGPIDPEGRECLEVSLDPRPPGGVGARDRENHRGGGARMLHGPGIGGGRHGGSLAALEEFTTLGRAPNPRRFGTWRAGQPGPVAPRHRDAHTVPRVVHLQGRDRGILPMKYNRLGRSGLRVSELSFGSWVTFSKQLDLGGAKDLMRQAFEAGVNFFDNAEAYANGEAEKLMGEALKDYRREDLVVSTKLFWGGEGPNDKGLSWKHLMEGIDNSLRRMQLEYVDLLFCHRPDPETPIEETVRAMDLIIRQGKAFYWGTSEWSAEELEEAFRIAKDLGCIAPVMEQPQYNMLVRKRFEVEYAPIFERHGLGTTIWSPLASGILTGKYQDGIPDDSRLASMDFLRERLNDRTRAQVAELSGIAEGIGAQVSQLAIAWCLENPNVSTVILGASSSRQLTENLASSGVRERFTDEVRSAIAAVLGEPSE